MKIKKSERPNRKITALILLLIEAAGIGVGVYLTLLHFKSGDAVCDIEGTMFSCSIVATSSYSKLLGIPIAYLGILTYLVCAILTLMALSPTKSKAHDHAPIYLLAIAIWSVLYSIFLAGIAFLIIKSVCLFCLALYVVNLALLICSAIWAKDVGEPVISTLFGDLKEGLGNPKVLGAGGVMVVLLIVSAIVFNTIKPHAATPRDLIGQFNLADNPWKGDPNSPIRIIEVSDPRCPWCAKAHDVIKEAEKNYGDKFHVFYVWFPIDQECNSELQRTLHQGACLGSIASKCADYQGKFWPYMDTLFANREKKWDADVFIGYANDLGLDIDRFKQCLTNPKTKEIVVQDVEDCKKNDIHSTPTVFFNGKEYGSFSAGLPKFIEYLERALNEQKHPGAKVFVPPAEPASTTATSESSTATPGSTTVPK